MIEQKILVTVYTDSGIFTGILSVPGAARLSDFINISEQFMHLEGKALTKASEKTDNPDEIYINKNAIKLLTTATDDDTRGTGAKGKTYPYVKKKPVRVKIYMTNYEISGNLYSFDQGDIHQILQQPRQFLACTDVTILDTRVNSSVSADFIAINWNNISALLKAEP
jgi:hypothetical protein